MAEEQIAAAWQLHVEQIKSQLESGWRDHVRRALGERFDALDATFELEVERRVADRLVEETDRARAAALRSLSERLNQTTRRLEQAEDGNAWAAALLDGACAHAPRVVLFGVAGPELVYEDHRALEPLSGTPARFAVAGAPAFAGVIDSMDAVIAMATPGELGETLCAWLGDADERRVCLVPIRVGQSEKKPHVAAILYADGNGEPVDINSLDVLAAIAGLALDVRQAATRAATVAPAGAMLSIAPAPAAAAGAAASNWAALPREEQELHARAQRFARVRVAEMRLYQAQAVRQGREQSHLYIALRGEMDRGRAQFRHEFMTVPSMIDYFHLELVRTLANDDASLLGEEYPGPLV
jgi:hypothetical protein